MHECMDEPEDAGPATICSVIQGCGGLELVTYHGADAQASHAAPRARGAGGGAACRAGRGAREAPRRLARGRCLPGPPAQLLPAEAEALPGPAVLEAVAVLAGDGRH